MSRPAAGLELLRRLMGGSAVTVMDIGVRRGIDPRWRRAAALLDIVGIDPDEAECRRLQAAAAHLPFRARYLPYALGAPGQREVVLHITRNPGSSSIYQPNTDFIADFAYAAEMAVVATVPVTLTTLDEVCGRHGIVPDYLKIDTQGYELNIMRGGTAALRTVKLLELEVEFNPQYRDQPLFAEVDTWLRDRGFCLLALRRSYWRRVTPTRPTARGGQLVHGDALYYSAGMVEQGAGTTAEEVLKLCLLLSAYRQDAFTSHLLLKPHPALAGIPAAERASIADALFTPRSVVARLAARVLAMVTRVSPVPLDHVALRRAVDALRPPGATDWHDPDFF